MINTSGHEVQVMPSYTPVNPSLMGFNPQNVTNGALGALSVADSLEKIKSFRQHAEEIAKTEHARNSILQAEADKAAILAGHLQTTKDAQDEYDLSHLKLQSEQNKLELPNVSKKAKVEGSALDLTANQQAFDATQQGTKQSVESITNASAFDNAFTKSLAAKNQAETDYQASLLNLAKAKEEALSFPADKARKDNLINAQIEVQKAIANKDNADAELARAKPGMAEQALKQKADAAVFHQNNYNTISQDYQRTGQVLARLEGEVIPDPSGGDPIKASQLASQLSAAPESSPIWKFWKSDPSITPYHRQVVQEILDQRARLSKLGKILSNISDQLGSSYNPQSTKPQANEEAQQAAAWIAAHPNDPRVAAIKQHYGI